MEILCMKHIKLIIKKRTENDVMAGQGLGFTK
jgi:hypothetical protein